VTGVEVGVGPLEASLLAVRASGRKALVPYVSGGISDDWVDIVRAVADAGADAVEIGIPFSDPVMDGPTIQAASQRSLDRGTTPVSIFGALAAIDAGVPLVAMTYYNLVFRAGHRRFARSLVEGGVAGAIVPDLCLEELKPWEDAAVDAGIETVLLAAPVTPDDRLVRLCERTRGFIYGVSVMGVTGERQSMASSAGVLAKRLKAVTDKPVIIGFGVSGPAQAVDAATESDGVVVASALMRLVLDGGGPTEVAASVSAIRRALDAG
jgi:tryptophan synthase alpha chain